MAHLKQFICASFLLLETAPDVLEKVLISCLVLNLLDFDISDLISELLGLHLMEGAPVFFPLGHFLLQDVPLKVDGGVGLLKLLKSMVSVHTI